MRFNPHHIFQLPQLLFILVVGLHVLHVLGQAFVLIGGCSLQDGPRHYVGLQIWEVVRSIYESLRVNRDIHVRPGRPHLVFDRYRRHLSGNRSVIQD